MHVSTCSNAVCDRKRLCKQANLVPLALVFAIGLLPGRFAYSEVLLKPAAGPQKTSQVQAVFEVRGELHLEDARGDSLELPMQVKAKFDYAERSLTTSSASDAQTLRYYRNAQAAIQIDGTEHHVTLGENKRHIAVARGSERAVLFCPVGSLTRDELELVSIPANTAFLSELLPGQNVAVGESWTVPSSAVAILCGWDLVTWSDVSATLRSVDGQIALIEMDGSAAGSVQGVITEAQVTTKLNFDVTDRQLKWLAMSLRESREPGFAEAGFQATARLRISMQPVETPPELSDHLIGDLPLQLDDGVQLLTMESPEGGFRCLHDRRWRRTSDNPRATTLRMVENNELIAQCNLSNLRKLPAGKQLRLESLKQDISRTLGSRFSQFSNASQSLNDDGTIRILQATAHGQVSGVPVRWMYYHLSNDEGRRLALVFTLHEEMLERFGAADLLMVNTFEFTELSESSPPQVSRRDQGTEAHDSKRKSPVQ
jgi:hypothetical protein